jgi:hypothetical protein
MTTFLQEIRFVGSMIVSDDTGQLIRLIQSLIIMVGMLLVLLRVLAPVLLWLNDVTEAYQFGSVILGIRISSLAWGLGLH